METWKERRSLLFGWSGARFSKVPKTFRARKVIPKTPTSLFCKAGFFSICCKGNKKITSKFRASRRLRFEDTKRIMSPEIRPKSFGIFEKRAPGMNTWIVRIHAELTLPKSLTWYSIGAKGKMQINEKVIKDYCTRNELLSSFQLC